LTAWITRSCCLNCSPSYFGLGGAVLARIRSFLSDRIQRVCFNGCLSLVLLLMYGVPQGSVTGLLLFLLYAAQMFDIIASFQLTGQPYADDTQVYISAPVGETQLCCAWPQDLKPTINGPPITRIVARFTHAPAQDSHVPALGSAGCSCGCRVPSSGAVVTVVTVQRVRRDYKYPDSTHELTNIM